MELVLLILKLDVQAVLDADLKFDGLRGLVRRLNVVDDKVLLVLDAAVGSVHRDSDEIAEAHAYTLIALVRLLHVLEVEVVGCVFSKSAWWLQLPGQVEELEVLALIEVVLDHADEIYANALVLDRL
jgi:hypothetical protein